MYDPDHMASSEANWSGSTVFSKTINMCSTGQGLIKMNYLSLKASRRGMLSFLSIVCFSVSNAKLTHRLSSACASAKSEQKVSEYNQEITQSQTTDEHRAP